MNRLLYIFIFSFLANISFAQVEMQSPYFPESREDGTEWKWKATGNWNEAVNSNSFTNDFVKAIDKSRFLDGQLIDGQLANMVDKTLAGQIRSIGGRFYMNSKKKPGKQYFFFGIEHQHILDTYMDKDLLALFLKGNKPYAGKTLNAPNSEFYNIYFNQLSGGVGYNFDKEDVKQQLQWGISLNFGQNYDYISLKNSMFYTDPDGEYLDVSLSAETKLSDTVWAEFYEVRGIGLSGELLYSYTKTNDFHFDVSFKNLGFVRWNKNAFSGTMDTSFVFNGLENDTVNTGGGSLPSDFDKNALRRLLFPNAETGSFNTVLPLKIGVSAGKFLSEGKLYLGMKADYYPFLKAPLMLEVFGTWNVNNTVYITPVMLYSSYGKLNFGLSLGANITKNLRLDIGSSYLNSMFSGSSLAGQGGFVRLGFTY
ncbi:MAG: hypothetical protein GXO89_01385 [Chlorobi bacterium]|nr:hypothetical protein [Chlorobiota bacterium]